MSTSTQPVSTPSPSETADEDDDSGNFLRYLMIIRRRLWIVAAIVAIGVTASVLYTMRQPKIYAATATVVVNPQAPRVLGSDQESVIELGAGSYWSNQEYYNTQVDILTNFPLARATVTKRNGEQYFYDQLIPRDKYPNLTTEERIDQAAETFKGMVGAAQNRESRIIAITVKDTDKALAMALANEHVRSYLSATVAKRTVGADKSSKFLSSELDAAEKALRESERELYEFKDKHDMISVSLEDKQSILASDIQRFTGALGDARIKRIELGSLRKRALGLKGEEVLESPVFALASNADTVDQLKKQYIDERQKFLEVQEEFGPKSDRFVQQKKKVDDLYAAIQGEARRATRELDEKYQAALAAESAFEGEVTRLKQEALALGPLNVEYNRLVRTQKTDEENYTQLIGRLHTSEVESRNEQINVDENEYARAAYLVSPRLKVNVTVGMMLSLMFGVGLAFLLEFMDRTIKS
ncbi:MAG: GumC family protein, partial [Kofleriaceae bacterium]|nr:GumC family protein [Kofleriaceae bacterium]